MQELNQTIPQAHQNNSDVKPDFLKGILSKYITNPEQVNDLMHELTIIFPNIAKQNIRRAHCPTKNREILQHSIQLDSENEHKFNQLTLETQMSMEKLTVNEASLSTYLKTLQDMDLTIAKTENAKDREYSWLSMGHDKICEMLEKLMHTIRINIKNNDFTNSAILNVVGVVTLCLKKNVEVRHQFDTLRNWLLDHATTMYESYITQINREDYSAAFNVYIRMQQMKDLITKSLLSNKLAQVIQQLSSVKQLLVKKTIDLTNQLKPLINNLRIDHCDHLIDICSSLTKIHQSQILQAHQSQTRRQIQSEINKLFVELQHLYQKEIKNIDTLLKTPINNSYAQVVVLKAIQCLNQFHLLQKIDKFKDIYTHQENTLLKKLKTYLNNHQIQYSQTIKSILSHESNQQQWKTLMQILSHIESFAKITDSKINQMFSQAKSTYIVKLTELKKKIHTAMQEQSSNPEICFDLFSVMKLIELQSILKQFDWLKDLSVQVAQIIRNTELQLGRSVDSVMAAILTLKLRNNDNSSTTYLYKSINLTDIDKALIFLQHIQTDAPFESIQSQATKYLQQSRIIISDFRNYLIRTLQATRKIFTQDDDPNDLLTTRIINNNADSYKKIWTTTKHCIQHIHQITKYHNRIKQFGQMYIQQYVTVEMALLYNTLCARFLVAEQLTDHDCTSRLRRLKCKSDPFSLKDEPLIGQIAINFIQLSQRIEKAIVQNEKRMILDTTLREQYLEKRIFPELKRQYNALLSKYGAESDICHEARQKLNIMSDSVLRQKQDFLQKELRNNSCRSEKVKRILQQLENIDQMLDIAEFLRQGGILIVRETLVSKITAILKQYEENFETLMTQQYFSKANQLIQQLREVEGTIFTADLPGLPVSNQAKSNQMSKQLKIQTENIMVKVGCKDNTPAEFKRLSRYFNEPDRINSIDGFAPIVNTWERTLTGRIMAQTEKLQNAVAESSFANIKTVIDELIQCLPQHLLQDHRDRYKKRVHQLDQAHSSKFNSLCINLSELKRRPNQKLQLQDIKEHLEYAHNLSNNQQLVGAIIAYLDTIWDSRVEYLRNKSLSVYVELTEREVFKFKDESAPYRSLIGNKIDFITQNIADCIKAQIQAITDKIIELLTIKNDGNRQTNQSDGQKLLEHIDNLQGGWIRTCRNPRLNQLRVAIESAYIQMSKRVANAYKIAVESVRFDKIFTGRSKQLSCRQQFEVMRLLGKTFLRIQKHVHQDTLRNIPQNENANMVALRKSLEGYPDLTAIQQQFICNMNIRINTVQNFRLMQFDSNSDRKKIQTSLKLVQEAHKDMQNQVDTYGMLTGRTLDLDSHRTRLNLEIRTISMESMQVAKKISTKSLTDDDIRQLNRHLLVLESVDQMVVYENKGQVKHTILEEIALLHREGLELVSHSKDELLLYEANQQQKIKMLNKKFQDKKDQQKNKTQAEIADLERDFEARKLVEENSQKKSDLNKQQLTRIGNVRKLGQELQTNLKNQQENQKNKQLQKLSQSYKDALKKLASCLILLKRMQIGVAVCKGQCEMAIADCLKEYCRTGKKYLQYLFREIERLQCNEGDLLLKQHKEFERFRKIGFKNNLTRSTANQILSVMNELSQKTRQQILSIFNNYNKIYTELITEYSQQPDNLTISNIKSRLIKLADQVKHKSKQHKITQGHKLLAYIFAISSIVRSDQSQGKVQFLYQPHASQVIAILLTCGMCNNSDGQLKNIFTEIKTGEGKSVVLAGMACYFALLGYEVSCMCYSRLLSQRDYNDFRDIFEKLGLEDRITYGTYGDITQRLYQSDRLRQQIRSIIVDGRVSTTSRINQFIDHNRILLVDEVDVFFDDRFFGQLYRPCANIKHQKIQKLASFVWENRKGISIDIVKHSQEYAQCVRELPHMSKILDFNVIDMVGSVNNFKHQYIIEQNRIAYVLAEGVSHRANFGWKTIFAYYYECERNVILSTPQSHVEITVLCCQISYAELPRKFNYFLGVTGTLSVLPQIKKDILKEKYNVKKLYSMPSVYGDNHRQKRGTRIISDDQHYSAIIRSIGAETFKGRPVMIFFRDIQQMNQFNVSKEFQHISQNSLCLCETNDNDSVRNVVNTATKAGRITLITSTFGRGTDFVVSNRKVIEAGGVHVIQTFISEEESEAVQIEGRTARQGHQGTYEMIIRDEELTRVELSAASLKTQTPVAIENTVNNKRNEIFNRKYTNRIKMIEHCQELDKIANEIIQCVANNNLPKLQQHINKLNEVPQPLNNGKSDRIVKTVIGIDATGSMSTALSQVLQNIQQCVFRTLDIINSKKEKEFLSDFFIQIVVYRNYSSGKDFLLQSSPMSNNAKELVEFLSGVKASGGQGREAVEVLYNHVLNKEENVDQLILIGDMPGNTDEDIKTKREGKKESYWKNTQYSEPLNPKTLIQGLIERKIPVHSFFLSSGQYFTQISKDTGGTYQEYKYLANNASELLTDFIVKEILNKIGGKEWVTEYKLRYNKALDS